MKKMIVSSLIIGAVFLTGCKNDGSKKYTVTKEQYDQNCYYEAFVSRITSLNFTVTRTESIGEKVVQTATKFDNGKIMSGYDEDTFYCDFKKGTYNAENGTWSYDYYYQQEGTMNKRSFEDETLPDDIYLPDIGFMVSYEEMSFNAETQCYEQIAESKTLNDYYVYSEVKAKFNKGNIIYVSWKYKSLFEPEKVYLNVMEITNYGSTSVSLPNVA